MPTLKKKLPRAYFFGEEKVIVNGKIIQDNVVKSEFDGKVLHVDKQLNDKVEHYDIKNILSKSMSRRGLLERLSGDFIHKRSKHKRSKHIHKRSKHKKTRKI